MRKQPIAWLLCALVLASPLAAAAQEQRSAIAGVVKDSSGGVLPGVTVEARSPALIGVASTVTDDKGVYRFPGLPPGVYTVTASLAGFASTAIPDIVLDLGRLLTVELKLIIASLSESVVVTGASPLIDVRQSASFNNIGQDEIERLPKGRDFTSVVAVAPGTNDENKAAGISIDGASGSDNRYVMDGIDTTNLQSGASGKALVTDMVDEVQVKSSGYNAEFGGATGGVISVITKSGSNNFRGNLVTYFSNRDLEGQNRQTLRLGVIDDRIAEYVTYPRDEFTRVEPGFTLGGPVMRDKVWFFTSYIPTLESIDRPMTFRSTGTSSTFHQTKRTHNSTSNVTAQISGKTRLKFSANLNPYYERGRLPVQDGTDDARFAYAGAGQDKPNVTYSGNIDYVASNKLYFAVRGGYFTYNTIDIGIPDQVRRVFSGANYQFTNIPASLQGPNGFSNIPTNRAQLWDIQSRVNVSADMTYYASLAGQHTFKAGMQFDRPHNDVNRLDQQKVITFNWDRTYTSTVQERLRGTYGYYSVGQFMTTGNIYSNNIALFVQDSWTVNNRLTLNLGLRTEREDVPSYVASVPGIHFSFQEKLAPRAGFAWDLKGDGKWKAYGSWGKFYDITKLDMPRASLGGDKSISYRFALDTYDWASIGAGTCAGAPSSCPAVYPGTFYEQYDSRPAANNTNNIFGKSLIDPDLKPMTSQEITLGLDHELTATTSVGFRWVRKWLNYTIEDLGWQIPRVGDVFIIGNPGFGMAEYTMGPDVPPQPPATRDYDGVEFHVHKRLANRWYLNASYLWSRLYGNYSGLASSDEVTVGVGGRTSPNNNVVFDKIYASYDSTGSKQPVMGPLATDRPHQFKTQVAYNFPFGTNVAVNQFIASGTPVTRYANAVSGRTYYMGRMSDGRTPTYSATDLNAQHEFTLPHNTRLQLEVNVLNLFDQKAVVTVFSSQNRDTIPLTTAQFFAGFDVPTEHAKYNIRLDPRFLMTEEWQRRRQVRFAVRFLF